MMATQTIKPSTNNPPVESRHDQFVSANQESIGIRRAIAQLDANVSESTSRSMVADIGTCVRWDTNDVVPIMSAGSSFRSHADADDEKNLWASLEAWVLWTRRSIREEYATPDRMATFSDALLKLHTEPQEEYADTVPRLKLEFWNKYLAGLARMGNVHVTWVDSPVLDSPNRLFEDPDPAKDVPAEPPNDWQAIVREFAEGINGKQPNSAVRETAAQIVQAAIAETVEPEFLVDFDGSLSLDLRLGNGLRMLAELTIDGELDAGFYDDNNDSGTAVEVKYLPQATAEELVAHLTQSLCQFPHTT